MIPIRKSLRNVPSSLQKDACTKSTNKMVEADCKGEAIKKRDDLYGSTDVRTKLVNIYNKKCAYCESFEDEPEIEHYRPKGNVTEEKEHKGYYWLSYEWSNLLPSCHDCNKTKYKGEKFPIEGKRVFSPIFCCDGQIDLEANRYESDYLQQEKALLLNPEMKDFDPFQYFKFSTEGEMQPCNDSHSFKYQQAKSTIDILGLNKRDKLFLNYRKKELRSLFEKDLRILILRFSKGELQENAFREDVVLILDELKKRGNPKHIYSFFWDYVYTNFGNYIAAYFKGKYRNPFINIYREHRSN